jgi:hypothetical protein
LPDDDALALASLIDNRIGSIAALLGIDQVPAAHLVEIGVVSVSVLQKQHFAARPPLLHICPGGVTALIAAESVAFSRLNDCRNIIVSPRRLPSAAGEQQSDQPNLTAA